MRLIAKAALTISGIAVCTVLWFIRKAEHPTEDCSVVNMIRDLDNRVRLENGVWLEV